MRRSLLALTSVVLIAAPASAHDLWLSLPSGAVVPRVHIHYGHPDGLQAPHADKTGPNLQNWHSGSPSMTWPKRT